MRAVFLILYSAFMIIAIYYAFDDKIGLATYWLVLAIMNLINYHNS